jgi:hypothetical protein
MFKRFTALAGALFLVWLFFSPILALVIMSKLFADVYFLGLLGGVLITYIVLGIIFYQTAKYFGIVEAPRPEDMIPLEELARVRSDMGGDYLRMALLGSPFILWYPVFALGSTFPVLAGVIGMMIFIATCAANWYPPLRIKVYGVLSQGETIPVIARIRAENTLQAMNAPLIFVSGFLMIFCISYLFP